jgi:hypothetical protein
MKLTLGFLIAFSFIAGPVLLLGGNVTDLNVSGGKLSITSTDGNLSGPIVIQNAAATDGIDVISGFDIVGCTITVRVKGTYLCSISGGADNRFNNTGSCRAVGLNAYNSDHTIQYSGTNTQIAGYSQTPADVEYSGLATQSWTGYFSAGHIFKGRGNAQADNINGCTGMAINGCQITCQKLSL